MCHLYLDQGPDGNFVTTLTAVCNHGLVWITLPKAQGGCHSNLDGELVHIQILPLTSMA